MKHPGTPVLYDPSKPVAEGGLNFRARFGVERNGSNLLAEGSYPVGNELKDGHPEFSMAMLKKLGWDSDLTDAERAAIEKLLATRQTGRPTSRAVSSVLPSSMVVHHSVMLKRVQLSGRSQIRCHCIASHFTRHVVTFCLSTRHIRISRLTVCQPSMLRSKSRTSQRTSRLS